ncbi:MAG: nuclear transport factor 2 family protein [Bacteroidetes bacterium]|nr:nuclear transport factor 2 family protein [Bacteroidota bacterium]
MQLVQYTRQKNDDTPKKGPLTVKIKIFEIFDKLAVARSEGDNVSFVDFFHLGNINGEWKIVNVIWGFQPQ